MKCEMCKKREATVHLTEIINDKVTKLHICEECAREKSEEMHSHFGLSDLLSGLMDFGPAMPEERVKEDVKLKCPVCKMTYYDFQRTGRLGCGKCYDIFAAKLSVLLRRIHGSEKHIGKMPFKSEGVSKEEKEDLQRFKKELDKLVRSEEFEKAALLRDKIKDLERKLGA